MTFEDFDLDYGVLDSIEAMGYTKPTPIQEQAIPVILAGHDLIACAQTGTGKTAAFVLPLLDKILQTPSGGINTLILVPTRELAMQIDQQIEAMSYYVDVSSIAIYGGGNGQNWNQQKTALTKGADIIIATPGRLIAQMQMGGFDFGYLHTLVLDEADRMLDMGFYDDLVQIISALPKERQTLCFSATMPPKIRTLTKEILRNPTSISIAISQPNAGITQQVYMAHDEQKLKLAGRILKEGDYKSVIIFSSTKDKVKRLEGELKRVGIEAKAFHSDLEQEAREMLMQAFKAKRINVLVGTDVLSRGIDVDGIELVLNYDVPPDPEDYVHRIGRTARAERKGRAVTFVNEMDQRKFAQIERLIDRSIEVLPMPEDLGPAPEYRPDIRRPKPGRGGSKPGGGGGNRGSQQRGGGNGGGERRLQSSGGGNRRPKSGNGQQGGAEPRSRQEQAAAPADSDATQAVQSGAADEIKKKKKRKPKPRGPKPEGAAGNAASVDAPATQQPASE
jgi:ATP-dependent RNA helicase RhlE